MPIISIFFGITIKMYYKEHNPPHIHAFYQGFEGLYSIKKQKLLTGDFPKKADKIVIEWIELYQFELLKLWYLAQKGKELYKIPGADQ